MSSLSTRLQPSSCQFDIVTCACDLCEKTYTGSGLRLYWNTTVMPCNNRRKSFLYNHTLVLRLYTQSYMNLKWTGFGKSRRLTHRAQDKYEEEKNVYSTRYLARKPTIKAHACTARERCKCKCMCTCRPIARLRTRAQLMSAAGVSACAPGV